MIWYAVFFAVIEGTPVIITPPNTFANATVCEAYLEEQLHPLFKYIEGFEIPESAATGICLQKNFKKISDG